MTDQVGRKFGGHIRDLRKARALTQEVLAEKSSLSVDAVRRIERGAFSPSLDTVRKLATGLEVNLNTLFEGFAVQRRDTIAELCDFLQRRKPEEIKLVWRVIQAMFDGR
ncbi:MAG TPA: helix-turn-helix transcriptional regulator [Myxococcales bacterium]|jgi:transcriptional regulator with XRE-family HTH domain|nr:helix-turn-helix transcriptional regulator [Myxococcales bacterium]